MKNIKSNKNLLILATIIGTLCILLFNLLFASQAFADENGQNVDNQPLQANRFWTSNPEVEVPVTDQPLQSIRYWTSNPEVEVPVTDQPLQSIRYWTVNPNVKVPVNYVNPNDIESLDILK